MITILSPAKNLNFKPTSQIEFSTQPLFCEEAIQLVDKLKSLSSSNLGELMNLSSKLTELNYNRYKQWSEQPARENTKQAILAFNGEVYNGLRASELSTDDLMFAQEHIGILSGLYGFLRPLDLIQPYRLEMGTPLKVGRTRNLYEFWGSKIKQQLRSVIEMQTDPVLLNLASVEYSKAAMDDDSPFRVITPVFKELRGESYKLITIYFKKARGLMTRFIVQNRIDTVEDIKHFDWEGYQFAEALSTKNEWVFSR